MELQHHGIKGMHWGVRRFQNKDGTRTPSGKKRYSASNKPFSDRDRHGVLTDVGANKVYNKPSSKRSQYEKDDLEKYEGQKLADSAMQKVSKEDHAAFKKVFDEYWNSAEELDDANHYEDDTSPYESRYAKAEAALRKEISVTAKKYMGIDYDPSGKPSSYKDKCAIDHFVVNMEDSWDEIHHSMLCHHGIKGMHWGVRRYRNEDGSLTPAGQKRYDRDQRENAGKKKGNKVGQADPDRWVREDLERTKRATDSARQLSNELTTAAGRKSTKANPRMDLSGMSDKELREKINREFMERQYNDLMNPPKISKGKEYVHKTLEITGTVLGVTSSALGIALAIKELRG